MNWTVIVMALVAGVAGTGLGGIVGVIFKNKGDKIMGRVLGFAGGVMIGVVSFEMIPEAISACSHTGKLAGVGIAVATVIGGMVAIYLVNRLLDFIENKRHKQNDAYRTAAVLKVHTLAVSGQDSKKSLLKAGVVMFIAISLHNFPEGMAIGASGTLATETGALVAIIIALHNIPEGMAISAPLVSGGVKGFKAILLTALAGSATVLGAALGLAVGGLGDIVTGICLALAGGAMMYVTFCELLPQSIAMKGDVPAVSMLTGLVLSIVFVFVL